MTTSEITISGIDKGVHPLTKKMLKRRLRRYDPLIRASLAKID